MRIIEVPTDREVRQSCIKIPGEPAFPDGLHFRYNRLVSRIEFDGAKWDVLEGIDPFGQFYAVFNVVDGDVAILDFKVFYDNLEGAKNGKSKE